jgi:hypothetical protein
MRRHLIVLSLWLGGLAFGCTSTSNGTDGGSGGGGGGKGGTIGQGGSGAGGGNHAGGSTGTGGSEGGVTDLGGSGTGGTCAACTQPTAIAVCPSDVGTGAQCNSPQTCCDGEREWVCGDCGNVTCTWSQACGSTGAAGASGSGGNGGQGGAASCRQEGQSCSTTEPCCSGVCAGVCTMIVSDRNMKRDFAPVNDAQILKAVGALPISSWRYKGDDTNARHIGPMAQDFRSTFHVGSNDKTILQVDGDGVSLAAIKALSQRLKDLEARNESLETQVSELRTRSSRSRRGDENRQPSGTQ